MMLKQRKNFEHSIFWNAQYNSREKGLKSKELERPKVYVAQVTHCQPGQSIPSAIDALTYRSINKCKLTEYCYNCIVYI